MKSTLFHWGIIKKVGKTVLPIMTSRLLNVIMSFIGILFVAHLGHTELAASALITATQIPIFLISSSPLFSTGILLGHAAGEKNNSKIGAIVQQAGLLALFIALPSMGLVSMMKAILLALGQTSIIAGIVGNYFSIYALALPALLLVMVLLQFFVTVSKHRYVMAVSFIGFFSYLFFAYVFIYGAWGLVPRHGVNGLAIAAVLQMWINVTLYFFICIKDPDFKAYKLFAWRLKKNFYLMGELLRLAWPITLQMSSELFAMFTFTIMVGWLGEIALAAQQISTQYFILLVVPILAISQSSSILVSQARGAKDLNLAKEYDRAALFIGLFFSCFVTLLFILFPKILVMLYLHQHAGSLATVKLATILLILIGFRLIFDTVLEIKVGSLRGLADTRWPMIISVCSIWIVWIPMAYFFGFCFKLGLIGMASVGLFNVALAALLTHWRWNTLVKQSPMLIEKGL